ncbi:hypothetical protein [Lactococcus garvieae]|jgi:hypothetical protein|uniref:hypothetical protein n=1 Tax=Lactococcus garvieae TaxID=1363 RepID=UPI0009BFF618|nr:hypothetical protein [Lactococcus garvieae]
MEYVLIFSAAVTLYFALGYVKATIKGWVLPNKVTWFLWALAPMIAFFATLSSSDFSYGQIPVFMAGFTPLLVFGASFINKKSFWRITRFDVSCALLSLTTLLIWYITKNPGLAIFLAIVSDALAALPTLIKAWRYPETESIRPFAAGIFTTGVAFIAIHTWNFAHVAFPVYLVLLNIVMTIILAIRNKKTISKTTRT